MLALIVHILVIFFDDGWCDFTSRSSCVIKAKRLVELGYWSRADVHVNLWLLKDRLDRKLNSWLMLNRDLWLLLKPMNHFSFFLKIKISHKIITYRDWHGKWLQLIFPVVTHQDCLLSLIFRFSCISLKESMLDKFSCNFLIECVCNVEHVLPITLSSFRIFVREI